MAHYSVKRNYPGTQPSTVSTRCDWIFPPSSLSIQNIQFVFLLLAFKRLGCQCKNQWSAFTLAIRNMCRNCTRSVCVCVLKYYRLVRDNFRLPQTINHYLQSLKGFQKLAWHVFMFLRPTAPTFFKFCSIDQFIKKSFYRLVRTGEVEFNLTMGTLMSHSHVLSKDIFLW